MANKSLDGVLTKKAHSKETFTEKHIEDLVACSDNESGYHYFCENFFYIQHPVRGKMLFEPFEYQKRLLDAYHGHRFNVNMLPRLLALVCNVSSGSNSTNFGTQIFRFSRNYAAYSLCIRTLP